MAPIVWAALVVVLCSTAQGYCPPATQAGRTALAHILLASPVLRSYGGNVPRQGGLPVLPALPQLHPHPTPRTLEARGWTEAHSSSELVGGRLLSGPTLFSGAAWGRGACGRPSLPPGVFLPLGSFWNTWAALGTFCRIPHSPHLPAASQVEPGEQMLGGSDVKLPCYQEEGHGHGEVS